jgi:UDP-2,3-diacylglucosamine pyrophosphatase LpxH
MHYKTVWISDLHLGTRGCDAPGLLDFLRHCECETLYLVGDVSKWASREGMIHDSLDAFVYSKPEIARNVITRDEKVDLLNKQLHRELTSFMIEDPHTITRCLNLMSVAHNLERIADRATNIAEDIVYLYEGRDIRHQKE